MGAITLGNWHDLGVNSPEMQQCVVMLGCVVYLLATFERPQYSRGGVVTIQFPPTSVDNNTTIDTRYHSGISMRIGQKGGTQASLVTRCRL